MPHTVIVGLPRWTLNGPAVFAERLVRGLADRGHDARILLTERGSARVTESFAELPVPTGLPCDRLPAAPTDSWGQRWEALERYLEERARCHYLMLHDWRNNVVAPRLSNRVHLIGLAQADHDLDFDQAERLGTYWDAIVAVSDPIHFKLTHRLPHLAHRMVTIRNAVPSLAAAPQKPLDGPLRICYSGELRRNQKRLDDTIEIARRLAARGVDFVLTLYGDGAYRAELETTSHDLVARGLVTFAGRKPGPELLGELAGQHVFLLTSEFEGLSIALLEAMSRACVPVVSNLSSQSLVVRNGISGLTAEIGDIEGFTAALARLATDRPFREQLAAAAFAAVAAGGYRVEDMLDSYLTLFDRLERLSQRRGFVRLRGGVLKPPRTVAGIDILTASKSSVEQDLEYINCLVPWPSSASGGSAPRRRGTPTPGRLEDYKVVVAASSGHISGVNVFAEHLVRQLRQRGLDARLHGSRRLDGGDAFEFPEELPLEPRDPPFFGWPVRWGKMIDQIEGLAPCIYLPNYDREYSCVCPRFSDRVKVVGIGHSDDPWHYEHLARIGAACDAIVGVSTAITRHLAALDPTLAGRLHTIPYGIPVDGNSTSPDVLDRKPGGPLRIVYTGRLVTHQKRAPDIVAVAHALARRNVPFEAIVVGDGPDRSGMEWGGRSLIMDGRLRFVGNQPNDAVLALLAACDAFLLPSSFEGLSVGMLEAMSRRVVPVVSDIRSGVPDVIHPDHNGLIAPVGDIERFADHLEFLQNNQDARRRMGDAAADTIATGGYRLEDMVDRYMTLFERIVSEPYARPAGRIVPSPHLADEITVSRWASRVAADPVASLRRVARRFAPRATTGG